jgi:uncharacterized protein YdeI (YjbR/CyaY-like superfamily)
MEEVYATNRQAWRDWLAANHSSSQGVWLVYYKVSSGKSSIRYSEAVKEALCFGWIDSKVQSLDSDRYRQVFTPRKQKSVWSKLNKQYIEELIEQGLMTDAGFQKIAVAKVDGSWISLDDIEALIIPPDLQQALDKNVVAKTYFETLSNSTKKNLLQLIASAKRPETRKKRIDRIITDTAQNKNPLAR